MVGFAPLAAPAVVDEDGGLAVLADAAVVVGHVGNGVLVAAVDPRVSV